MWVQVFLEAVKKVLLGKLYFQNNDLQLKMWLQTPFKEMLCHSYMKLAYRMRPGKSWNQFFIQDLHLGGRASIVFVA
jgi:hypothetical protein